MVKDFSRQYILYKERVTDLLRLLLSKDGALQLKNKKRIVLSIITHEKASNLVVNEKYFDIESW